MLLKILLLLVLLEYTLQGRHGRQYYRHKGHHNRQKRHHNRHNGVRSWRHSNRYRGSKPTQYYRYGPRKPTLPPSTTTTPPVITTPPGGRDVRLPLNLYPVLYELELQPFIYETNPTDFYFIGKVTIEMECRQSTNEIVLHSNQLNITTSSVRIEPMAPGQNPIIPTIEFDTVNHFLILKTNTQLVSGSNYSVYIEFRGPLLSRPPGFYQSSYQRGNDTIYIASTQMAPTDARKAFPCFDEPAVKARFSVTLIRKKHLISLSNMNQIRSKILDNNWVADHYAVTPLMSTYLLAFVVCDFTFKEETTDNNVLYKAWTRPEAIDQTTYALDVGVRILTFFEEYFATPFPLPKQDMIAVPAFAFGAMENWGLIVYRETFMLYDPLDTAENFKQFVTMVTSHELAHNWFGNLVTPSWWDDIWLNEGFANYIAFVGMDFIQKDWLVLDNFVVSSVHNALSFDGVISSHPIYVPVSNTDEIFQLFDSISYEKGGSVIRMMQFFLGDETFKRGLQLYITERAYGVASRDDLWDALGRQSIIDGKPQKVHDVKRIMDTWTLQMNYPTVFMERMGNDIKLSQSRYLRDKNATDPGTYNSSFGYKWEIPFTFTTQTNKDFNQNDADIIWMGKEGTDILLSGNISGNDWFIGNIKQYGFYRVNYPKDNWEKLIDQLKMDHTMIHPVNRAQIINDAWNLAKSGDLSMNTALKTVEYLSREDSYFPFFAANNELVYVGNMLERTELYGDFSAFMKKAFSIPLNELGYNNTGSGHLEILLRRLVVEGACDYGNEDCINNAINSFQNLMQGTGPINPIDVDSRQNVYDTAIKYGGVKEWDFVYNRYKTSNVASEKLTSLVALSHSREVWILSRFLQYTLTDDIRRQDGFNAFRLIARNPIGRSLVWDFLRGNWNDISNRFGSASFLLGGVTAKFNTEFDLQSIQTFKDSLPNLGNAAAAFDRAIETTRANIKWMESNFQIIKDWLQSLK
ncbi:aminopeptidase N-like isoform X1 [Mytilus californianus]|uniref:aminopeptidase N-like isoform X1 n=1 Tax=Mytilus californianus TaxID=6549 RepID=UPI002245FE30|nr:aminopeptidase N-like isoform X1 [Mytilus californianus]XP_052097492.1 aminopeptidase N-like isoform X1 [Mytilus californianus]XP_052097493.1 aminopeptidase N-like isoform X1 [Mytilus californianus]XP_052097494.1 aminopeptidase N-like isoform X1 [Mytilus californianus]